MTSDSALFFDHIGRHCQQTLVSPLLESELPRIISQCDSNQLPNGCLLADIGDFLVQVLEITAELAHVLVGHHILEHTKSRTSSLEQEPDLRTIGYLDDKHEALKTITTDIRKIKDSVNNIWQETPPPPPPPPPPLSAPSSHRRPRATPLPIRESPSNSPASRSSMANHWERVSHSGSYHVEDPLSGYDGRNADDNYHVPEEDTPSLEQLSSRGSGTYKCPQGESCKKGGVHSDGRIRIFSRNSEFKAHLLRHEKLYKCDLPGCPNKGKGFARPDQLKRHKQTVNHDRRGS